MNWKGELAWVLVFMALPALGAAAAWIALRWSGLDGLDRRRWTLLAVLLFLATRVGTHLAVFHLLRYGGSHDLLRAWEPVARAVLEGRDPDPLVDNLYGPVFPWILAAGYALSGGRYAPAIDVPFVLADAAALALLLRIARRRFEEPTARRLLLAVLLSPLLWHGEIVRTQDEPMFLLFLLGTLDLLETGREGGAVACAALGTACTKALFPFWVLPILLAAGGGGRRIAIRVAAAGGATAAVLGASVLLGWDPASRFHPGLDLRGSSAWFLFAGSPHLAPGVFRAGLAATALLMAAAALGALRGGPGRGTGTRAALGVTAVQGAFFALSPFTLPPHLVQGLPFLLWQAAEAGATRSGPGTREGILLGLLAILWQVPALGLNSEFWRLYPPLLVALAAWAAWTAFRALVPAGGAR